MGGEGARKGFPEVYERVFQSTHDAPSADLASAIVATASIILFANPTDSFYLILAILFFAFHPLRHFRIAPHEQPPLRLVPTSPPTPDLHTPRKRREAPLSRLQAPLCLVRYLRTATYRSPDSPFDTVVHGIKAYFIPDPCNTPGNTCPPKHLAYPPSPSIPLPLHSTSSLSSERRRNERHSLSPYYQPPFAHYNSCS